MLAYELKEVIVLAAMVTLAAAWIKLMRQKGDPRLRAACGLLAYFAPIVGPLAALVILNLYDRRNRVAMASPELSLRTNYTWARDSA